MSAFGAGLEGRPYTRVVRTIALATQASPRSIYKEPQVFCQGEYPRL